MQFLETVPPSLVNGWIRKLMLSHSLMPFCLTAWHGAPQSAPHLPEQPTALEQCSLYQQGATDKAWMDPPTRMKIMGPNISVVLILNSLEQAQGFPVGLEFGPVCHTPIKHNCLLVKQCQACLSQMPVYWLLREKRSSQMLLLGFAGCRTLITNKWNDHKTEMSHITWFGCNSCYMKKNDCTGLGEPSVCIKK